MRQKQIEAKKIKNILNEELACEFINEEELELEENENEIDEEINTIDDLLKRFNLFLF